MNFLKQALAYFFPPIPLPPMRRACGSHPTHGSPARSGGPRSSSALPRRTATSLPSGADRRTQSQLNCELADNLRRAREYELENPNAVRQDIQKKIQHILVRRPGRPRKRKAPLIDACGCDGDPTSALGIEKEEVQHKIREVYIPSLRQKPLKSAQHRSRSPEWDSDSTFDRCSCSASACFKGTSPTRSGRGDLPVNDCSTGRTDSPDSLWDLPARSQLSPSVSPSRQSRDTTGGNVCLATPVSVRTQSAVRGRSWTGSNEGRPSRRYNNGLVCSRIPQKRKLKNRPAVCVRKLIKSR